MTKDDVQFYKSKVKDNSCILNVLLSSMGKECPDSVCSMLNSKQLLQVFEDNELMVTAQALFDKNLSIISASKEIFVHRNTLVYRIEKIKKKIGLDIRKFEDAMTFKILSMLYKNVKS